MEQPISITSSDLAHDVVVQAGFRGALEAIRLDADAAVWDAQQCLYLLTDPNGYFVAEVWRCAASDLGAAVLLHMLFKRRAEGTPASLEALVDMLVRASSQPGLWHEMMVYPHLGAEPLQFIAQAAHEHLLRGPAEAESVLFLLRTFLGA